MPTDYRLDATRAVVLRRAWGALTDAESTDLYRKLQADPAFDASFCQLCDLRELTEIEATAPSLRALARIKVFDPSAKRAFVAPDDLHFGLARMLQVFAEQEGSEVGVFRTMREAEEWLGIAPSG